jgi:hypothetical protein
MSFNYYNVPPPSFGNNSMPYGQPRPPPGNFCLPGLNVDFSRPPPPFGMPPGNCQPIEYRPPGFAPPSGPRTVPPAPSYGPDSFRSPHPRPPTASQFVPFGQGPPRYAPGPLPGAPPYAEPRMRGNRPPAGPGYTPRWNGQRFNRARVNDWRQVRNESKPADGTEKHWSAKRPATDHSPAVNQQVESTL